MLNSCKKLKYDRYMPNFQTVLTVAIIVVIKSRSSDKGSSGNRNIGGIENPIFMR